MVWIILLMIICALIVFLLCTPFILTVDTDRRRYRLTWWGIVQASLVPDEKEIVLIRLRVLFLSWWLHPLRKTSGRKKSEKWRDLPKKSRKRSLRHLPRRIWRVVRSFRVQRCEVDLDTGDPALNAWLFPACWLLSDQKRFVRVNYLDNNRVDLRVRNSLLRMLYAFIR